MKKLRREVMAYIDVAMPIGLMLGIVDGVVQGFLFLAK